MFGLKKSPLHRFSKHNSADSGFPVSNHANPFDSDDEFDTKKIREASARTSSEPSLVASNLSSNPFDDDETKGTSSTQWSMNSSARNRYKNDFRDSGGLENQTVQELEIYSVYKAEETTKSVNGCLKIAEEMREDATKTLVTLHQQGEQITRTHMVAADMDHDLSRFIFSSLRNLGGGMSIAKSDDAVYRKGNHLEQRERLGLTSASKERSHTRKQPSEPTNALQKVEILATVSSPEPPFLRICTYKVFEKCNLVLTGYFVYEMFN
ncbi:UNVERIFIED_CONTAM: SNAP25 homologous protein SNAP33 [Sesamum angustifolium]|uniref:SNAP25 homologous protein SNAP33 n=1 Tax=Sesamum angustifolium TaxID=2727405 RepID=A0AAW2QAE8_9LAMI